MSEESDSNRPPIKLVAGPHQRSALRAHTEFHRLHQESAGSDLLIENSGLLKESALIVPVAPQYGKLSILSWAHFLNDGAANYLPGILPAILVSMGLSTSLAGVLMGILVLGQGLQPLSGLLADRLGGRSLTVIGLGCGAVAAGLVAFTSGIVSLAIVLILLGVSNSLFHPQTLAAVRHASGDRHGIGMSVFMVGGELGRGVWPLAASLLVTAGGLGSIWVLGLPGLLTVPLLWRATTPLPPRTGHAARLEWHRHLKPLFKLVLFCGSRAVLLYTVVTYVPVLWNEQGGSLAGGAGFITVLMISGLLGNLAGGRLGDRGGRRRVIVLGMSVGILSTVGFILLPQGAWTWALIALVGAGLFATVPLTVIMGQDIAPENRSFGSGMAVGLSNALGAIGLMALGLIAGAFGVLAALWIAVAIGAASIPLLWLMDK